MKIRPADTAVVYDALAAILLVSVDALWTDPVLKSDLNGVEICT